MFAQFYYDNLNYDHLYVVIIAADGTGTPDPNPNNFSKLMCLMTFT